MGMRTVAKTKEYKDDGHENNLGDRVAKIDKRCENTVPPFVAPKKKPQRNGKNKSKK